MAITNTNSHFANQSVNEKLFSLLVESVKDIAIFMIDPNGYIMSWNNGAERIKGYSEEEAIGKHISIFYAPEDNRKSGPAKILALTLKNGEYKNEGWRIRKDGSRFWADVVFTALYDSGVHIGFAKVTRDITERKKIEDRKTEINAELEKEVKKNTRQIIDSKLRFDKLIENSYDGLALVNKYFRSIYRSPSAERIMGWKNTERANSVITDSVHPHDVDKVKSRFAEALKSPGVPLLLTYRVKHKTGRYIWLETMFTNRLDTDNINAIICNFRDITANKQADEILQKTVKELFDYKYALEESAIVAVTDHKGIIQYVNHNFCKISKYREQELLGQDHRIINSSYHSKSFIKDLWKTIANGKIWKGELKNKAKDGSFYWVDTTIVPFLNDKGKPYQYIAIRSDITERKSIQEKIIESEHFIKTITDNIPALIIYWTADMRCLFANKACLDFLGKPYHEVVGVPRKELRAGSVVGNDTFSIYIEKVLQGQAQTFENQVSNKNGQTQNFQFHYLPDWEGDTVKGFFSFGYDITALELAQKERNKAELFANEVLKERNTILESIGDAFFAVDKSWIVTYWNKVAGEVLGKTKDEMVGNNFWAVFPESIDSESYKKYHLALKTNQSIHFEDYYQPLDKWYEISAYPTPNGLSIYFKDIAERKRSEIHLRSLNEDLQKHAKELAISNSELEQFAYVASHDLQEPLRMVTSFLSQLSRKYIDVIDDKGQQYIHFAVDGSKRMRQIILDLLEFSRIGKTEDRMEEVDTNKLIQDILALFRKQIQEQRAKISFNNLPKLQTYKVPLRQVFQNLIGNSLKYQEAGKAAVIEISSDDLDTYWSFSVKDNGIGIDPEYFEKIFIIFQRLHNKEEYSGTGMGLAVTKKIVENLGGKIWVESEEGKGSTFYFTILKNNQI